MNDAQLHDEAGRLAALHRYEVLDTPREAAFDRITGLVKTVFQAPFCAVSLVDSDRQWFKSCVGLNESQTPRDVSFCTHTIQKRHPLVVPDALLDERFRNSSLVTSSPFLRSYLGVPLCTPDGYNVGSLCVMDVQPREFSPQQIDVLTSFAALVVDELELRRIAETDHLTGASTRRSFTLDVEKALTQYRRSGTLAALIVLDIDHFKKINDTFGHPAGDAVLQCLGSELKLALRTHDVLGRLGGEEFGILLRETNEDDAVKTMERLRRVIENTQVPHSPVLTVTASFGLATVTQADDNSSTWMERADCALYEAKRGGRNRCCTAMMAVGA